MEVAASAPASAPARGRGRGRGRGRAGAAGEELRVDPEDGEPYTLEQLKTKFKNDFGEDEIKAYWEAQMMPMQQTGTAATPAGGGGAKEQAPAAAAGGSAPGGALAEMRRRRQEAAAAAAALEAAAPPLQTVAAAAPAAREGASDNGGRGADAAAPQDEENDCVERRRNPEDGKTYTFEEFREAFEQDYLIEEMRKYWRDSMKPVPKGTASNNKISCRGVARAETPKVTGAPKPAKEEAQQPAAAAARAAVPPQAAAPRAAAKGRPGGGLGFAGVKAWLAELDDSGVLQQYSDCLVEQFGDSVDDLADKYAPLQMDGKRPLDKQFFADCGVKKIGHKRIFERYFDGLVISDKVSKIQEQLHRPEAKDQAEDLPIDLVEAFYGKPGGKLCEVAASGDVRALSVFLALCGIIGIDWREVRNDIGETVLEAAGSAGHRDLAKALVREGAREPLAAMIAYGDASDEEVERRIQAGAVPDVYCCAAAAQLEDETRRSKLLAMLGDADKAAGWLSEALGGSSREWVAALRAARAYGVEMRV